MNYGITGKIKRGIVYFLGSIWAVVTLYPLLFTFLSSMKNNDEIFSSATSALQLPKTFRFENYVSAFIDGNLARSLVNSIFISGVSTILVILLAAMVAYIITRYGYKFSLYIALYFTLGIMIPIHSTLVPLVKIVSKFHGNNNYLMLSAIYVAFNLPLAILIISAQMRSISKSMDESAILDGCGPVKLFTKIMIPLSMPALSTVGIITFLYIYNDLLFGVMFISKKSLYTITLAMQTFVGSKVTTYGPIFASIIISIIPMIVIYLLFQSKVEKGLSSGAVKE